MATSRPPAFPTSVQGPIPIAGRWTIRAVPVTSWKADAPTVTKLTLLETPFPIRGQSQNLPASVSGKLTWRARNSITSAIRNLISESITVQTSGPAENQKFEVKIDDKESPRHGQAPLIHAVRMELFSKGYLGYQILLDFPHAPELSLEPKSISFDFPCSLDASLPSVIKMGAAVHFHPVLPTAFDKCPSEIRLVENDEAKGESKNDADGMAVLEWEPAKHKDKAWFVGFQGPARDSHLVYPEPQETGGFEYDAELWLQDPGSKAWHRAERKPLLIRVDKPKLVELEHKVVSGFLLTHFEVSGRIEGFDTDSVLHLRAELYFQTEAGIQPFENASCECVMGKDGRFQMSLGHLSPWEKGEYEKNKTGFFVAIRVASFQAALALPMRQVLEYDVTRFSSLAHFLMDDGTHGYVAYVTTPATDLLGNAVKLRAMLVTPQQLKQIMPLAPDDVIDSHLVALNQALGEYEIHTPLRLAHFFTQTAHETDQWRGLTEYADGRAYENRKDLGNAQPGDGPRFKGRGLLHLTGRANYTAFQTHRRLKPGQGSLDILSGNNANQVAQPLLACFSGGWFWRHGNGDLNPFADADDLCAVTRRINAGLLGLEKRFEFLKSAYSVFSVGDIQKRIAKQEKAVSAAKTKTA